MAVTYSLNCKGRLLNLSNPIVMGILNITPDSFFDGAVHTTEIEILTHVEKMLTEGATIIDIGGMTSKPGSVEISCDEELKRVIPVIEKIRKQFPHAYLSIDTYRSKVASVAIVAGADIINDISAGEWDSEIIQIAAQAKVPYIAMHIQGRPIDMQQNPSYTNVTEEVYDYFVEKIRVCTDLGIHDLIIDPGFGFGKTIENNYQLLHDMAVFSNLSKPILAGISRKSMICKPLNVNPSNAINGTTALHMIALQNGADILRVHDVKEALQCIKLFEIYSNSNLS